MHNSDNTIFCTQSTIKNAQKPMILGFPLNARLSNVMIYLMTGK